MNGGTRLRLHRSGMTHSINVLHAVAESANIRHVVASQRRFSSNFLLSPCGGCGGGLEAIFRQAVCAMSATDGDGLWLYRCVLREIRTRLCRTHDGLAGLRSAVAAKIAIFA